MSDIGCTSDLDIEMRVWARAHHVTEQNNLSAGALGIHGSLKAARAQNQLQPLIPMAFLLAPLLAALSISKPSLAPDLSFARLTFRIARASIAPLEMTEQTICRFITLIE